MGDLNASTVTFIAGLVITSILIVYNVKGALIAGIALTTLFAIPIGRIWGGNAAVVLWKGLFAAPDFSIIFKLNFVDSIQFALWPVIFAFLFTDMFDSLSTFMGVAEAADLKDDNGEPRNIRQSLIVDSLATLFSGLFGTSSGTSYIESATGIEQGGRSGLTAVVAGLLFLPFMFFSPLLLIVPNIATAPVLVLVGVFMMKPVMKIHWEKFDDAIPAFLSLILIPLTYSITQGIIWGFLTWTVIKIAAGKFKEVPVTLLVIDVFAVISLVNQ
jgi:AGZA family xanthine/uracil permease-like MFS transporter